jgi:hypothetical protein
MRDKIKRRKKAFMTSSVSAISSSSVSSSGSSSSSTSSLSEETKQKLKALGLNPSSYTSEAAAKAAITAAQQQAQQSQKSQSSQGSSNSMETIETETKSLAATMGVIVGNSDTLDDIFSNISTKVSELQSSAGTDETKKSEAGSYASQYSTLYSQYSQATATQNMTGATALSNYNKASLGLS